MTYFNRKLLLIAKCKLKYILIIVFVGFILFTVILGYMCCEEYHSKGGRKLMSHSLDNSDHIHHTNVQKKARGQHQERIDLSLNKDSAVNTLPRPQRTKKKGHKKIQQRKGARHQTPPLIFGDQGNLVTGAIANQHYNYQLTYT